MIGQILPLAQIKAGIGKSRALRDQVFAATSYIVDRAPEQLVIMHDEVLALGNYAIGAQTIEFDPDAKVEVHGARNLVGPSFSEWQSQMLAVAVRVPRVKPAILHIILSLAPDETWTDAQREETITIVLETLGLRRCQAIWAEHKNTANRHIHIVVSRIDPVYFTKAGSDWPQEDLHQAVALLDERHNRKREANANYVAQDGVVYHAETRAMVRDNDGHFVKDWYKSLARKHDRIPLAYRHLRTNLLATLRLAATWQDFHERLANDGLEIERVNRGCVIKAGGRKFKGSSWDRQLSLVKLEQKFGPFSPRAGHGDPAFETYSAQAQRQAEWLRGLRDLEIEHLDCRRRATLDALTKTKEHLRAAVAREEFALAKACLNAAFVPAIKASSALVLRKRQWTAAGRPVSLTLVEPPCLIQPASDAEIIRPRITDDLPVGWSFWRTDYVDEHRQFEFSDLRSAFVVDMATSVPAIDGALEMAAQRWTKLRISGPVAFVELASKRARTLRISAIEASPCRRFHREVDEITRAHSIAEISHNQPPRKDTNDPTLRPNIDHSFLAQAQIVDELQELANLSTGCVKASETGGRVPRLPKFALDRYRHRSPVLLHDVPRVVLRRGEFRGRHASTSNLRRTRNFDRRLPREIGGQGAAAGQVNAAAATLAAPPEGRGAASPVKSVTSIPVPSQVPRTQSPAFPSTTPEKTQSAIQPRSELDDSSNLDREEFPVSLPEQPSPGHGTNDPDIQLIEQLLAAKAANLGK